MRFRKINMPDNNAQKETGCTNIDIQSPLNRHSDNLFTLLLIL